MFYIRNYFETYDIFLIRHLLFIYDPNFFDISL